jgi:hypothetical protein
MGRASEADVVAHPATAMHGCGEHEVAVALVGSGSGGGRALLAADAVGEVVPSGPFRRRVSVNESGSEAA